MIRRNKKYLKYGTVFSNAVTVLRNTRSIFEHYNTDYFFNQMIPNGWKWFNEVLEFTDQGNLISSATGYSSNNLMASPVYYSCVAEVCTVVTPTVATDISSLQSLVDFLNSIPGKPAHILFRLHESIIGSYRMGIAVDYDINKDFQLVLLDTNDETGNQYKRVISNTGGVFTHFWDGTDLTATYTKTIAI